jgi:hypothetical protein
LGNAHKCSGVQSVNGIPTPLPLGNWISKGKTDINNNKYMHRFDFAEIKNIQYHKNELQHKHGQYNGN